MRKRSVAVAGLLSLALVVGGAPAIAQAAEIRQVMVSIDGGYDPGTNPGFFRISIDTDEPVAAIHADFLDEETGQPSGAADDFVFTGLSGQWQQYVNASPVVMEPGRYLAQLTITDADGVVTTHTDSSYLPYDVVATVEDVALDRRTIDWDTREVTVTGIVRGRWPGTGEVRPLAGAEVGFWVHYGADEPIITAADGTFRRTFTMSGVINTIELWYGGNVPHIRDGGRVEDYVTIAPQPTRVSVRVDKRRTVVGDPIVVSGKVERLGADGWVPAPAGQYGVTIGNGCDDTGCVFDFNGVETSADGTFSARTAARRTGYFTAIAQGGSFLQSSNARSKVVRVDPVS